MDWPVGSYGLFTSPSFPGTRVAKGIFAGTSGGGFSAGGVNGMGAGMEVFATEGGGVTVPAVVVASDSDPSETTVVDPIVSTGL